MKPGKRDDPQWALVVEIAVSLWVDGEYVTDVDPMPTQRLVDVLWAAHQAGRVLGGRSRVVTIHPTDLGDRTVNVSVTVVDPDGRGLRRAEEGLTALMQAVLDEQAEH